MDKPQPNAVPDAHGSEVPGHAPSPADSPQPRAGLSSSGALNPAANVQPASAAQAMGVTQSLEASPAATGDNVQPLPPGQRSLRPKIRHLHMPGNLRTFESLRYRNFRLLWGATGFSSGGFWLQQVIIGWLAFDLTQSALLTSIALGLDTLPVLLVGPLGGLLVDNFDRRKLLALVFTYQATITLAFSILVFSGQAGIGFIFGFIFLMGLSWVVTDPTRMSLIPNIVPRKNLMNAFALNSLAFSTTRLAAPVMGGILIALVGAGPTLLLQVSMQLMAIVMALKLRVPHSIRSRLRLASTLAELMEGVRYVKNERIILALFLFGGLPSVLVMPFAHGLMPVYAAEVFHVGPTGLGLLLAALGAGSTVGTIVLASLGNINRRGRLVLGSVVVMGTAMAVFSQNATFVPAFLNLMVLSAGMMVFFSTSSATIQSIVSDEFRGRVSGLYMITWGMFLAGSLLAGALAERFGAPGATLIGAGILGVVFGLLTLRFRYLWSFTTGENDPAS